MKTFGGTTPQEKAMSTLIHDTNKELSELKWHNDELGKAITEFHKSLPDDLKKSFPSAIYVRREYIKSRTNGLRKALDEYIERFQKDFIEV